MKSIINEKGIALVLVMVLALVALAFVSGLLFMLTQGTIMSGAHRFFRTAEDANYGGISVVEEYVGANGAVNIPGFLVLNACNPCSDDPDVVTDNIDLATGVATCRCDKLCNTSSQWTTALCDEDPGTAGLQVSMDPTTNSDMTFILGAAAPNQYTVFSKIVGTVKGNTADSSIVGGGTGGGFLGGFGTTESKTTYSSQTIPTLYRIELQAQATTNPAERSRLSVLYAR